MTEYYHSNAVVDRYRSLFGQHGYSMHYGVKQTETKTFYTILLNGVDGNTCGLSSTQFEDIHDFIDRKASIFRVNT